MFFVEIITLLDVEMNHFHHQFLENSDNEPSPQFEVTEVCVFGSDITDET
jgi:hypothetical protein